MVEDKHTDPVGRTEETVVSYGAVGDCGPGSVLSGTKRMRQLKGSYHCCTMNKDLLTAAGQEDATETQGGDV